MRLVHVANVIRLSERREENYLAATPWCREGALFGGTARTSRTTGEMASHLRHFQELRAELSRGGLLSGTTRMNHTTGEIASN